MAFALFASAGYFFKSFASQTGTEGAWWFLMAIIVISLGLWAYGNWGTQATKKGKRYFWGYAFPIADVSAAIVTLWALRREVKRNLNWSIKEEALQEGKILI